MVQFKCLWKEKESEEKYLIQGWSRNNWNDWEAFEPSTRIEYEMFVSAEIGTIGSPQLERAGPALKRCTYILHFPNCILHLPFFKNPNLPLSLVSSSFSSSSSSHGPFHSFFSSSHITTAFQHQTFQLNFSNYARGSNAFLLQLSTLGTFQRTVRPFFLVSVVTFLAKGF